MTVGLYLHDCSLTDVDSDLLAPLNSTLRYLWLNGNELQRLDVQLEDSFAPLHHLRLGSNPLRCDCGAAWLRSFFDRHVDAFRGALPPSCYRPLRLRGLLLNDVNPADLRCRPPSFTSLEIRFDTPAPAAETVTRPRLLCAAVGDPLPILYWIQPNGRTTRYERPTRNGDDAEQVEALLKPMSDDDQEETSMSGLYTCIANNDVGNVTMTVVIPPQRRPPVVQRRDNLHATSSDADGRSTTTTTTTMSSTPAILQSILLGDSLLQLQRLAMSNAPSPPPYSLIAGRQHNVSHADHSQQQVLVKTSRARSVTNNYLY